MRFSIVYLSALIALPLWASAQQKTLQLDEVTVTANKVEQKLSQTGKVVTVLSDSVLQHYATQTVSELLSRQAGVMIVGAQSTYGTQQDVFMRGAGSGNTLILLDGIPVYDPSGVAPVFDLNLLTVGECERIEILKGAQSTLYGSDAVAGVINIFTRKGSAAKKPFGGSASLNVGSYGTQRLTAGVNGSTARFYYNVQYTRLQSKGFSSATDSAGNRGFDPDGIRQNTLLSNIGIHLTPQLTLKLRGVLSYYKNDVDAGAFADEKDYTTGNTYRMGATGLDYNYGKGRLVANYAYSYSRRDYLNDSLHVEPGASEIYSKGTYAGKTQFAELYNSVKLGPVELVTGADYRFNNLDQSYLSISSYGPYASPPIGSDSARTSQVSVYASGLLKTDVGFFLEVGGRLNRHSLYGTNSTYSFNPSYVLNQQVKVFVNASSGFRVPSLYQLYSPYGNRSLNPEKSQSVEVGTQVYAKDKRSNLRVLYFDRRIRDVIFFQSLNVDPYGRYINFDRQHDHGWEVEGQVQARRFSVWGNLTLLQGAVTTKVSERDTTYNNLFRRPKVMGNLGVGYQFNPKAFVSATLRSVGQRTDRFYNDATFQTENVTLAAYSTVDVYGEYRVLSGVRLYADLRNVFDARYVDAYGYNTRRFNVMAGVRVNW